MSPIASAPTVEQDIHPLELLFPEPEPDDELHYVHMECQLDRDEVITFCNKVLPWSDLRDDSQIPQCLECFTPPHTCPVCHKTSN